MDVTAERNSGVLSLHDVMSVDDEITCCVDENTPGFIVSSWSSLLDRVRRRSVDIGIETHF